MSIINNKGFTLVELLAVIVILAIVMLIGVSSIGPIISNARKSSLKAEALSLVSAAKNANIFEETWGMSIGNSQTDGVCYSLETLKTNGYYTKNSDNFSGSVKISKESNGLVTYKVWMAAADYGQINGEEPDDNMTVGDYTVYTGDPGDNPINICGGDVVLVHSGTIPEGGIYYVKVSAGDVESYTGATATYTTGQAFPDPQQGDVYVYGDYEYRYNQKYNGKKWEDTSIGGWGVRVLSNKKDQYDDMLSKIGEKLIKELSYTFAYCSELTKAPIIPGGVTNMVFAFAFCSKLTTAPIIPNGVINMGSAFTFCSKLTTGPEIPDGVTNIKNIFNNCTLLVNAPIIPSSVTDMSGAFMNCTSLVTAPAIPGSVELMGGAFFGCGNLTESIEINANPTNYFNALFGTQISSITGSTTLKNEILATK